MSRNSLLLIFAPLLGLLAAMIRVIYLLYFWTYNGPSVEFEIQSGQTFGVINRHLKQQNLIPSERLFHRYCQYHGLLEKFKSGVFVIPSKSNIPMIVDTLINGKSLATSITIPEGKNIFEIAHLLENAQICPKKDFLALAQNDSFLETLNLLGPKLEGHLYPETYLFSKGQSCKQVVEQMVKVFHQKTQPLFESQDLQNNDGNLSQYEILILASIIEKETGAKHERPIISGVFHNRLKKHMRLQSDPTTIYGMWERYKGNITKSDLLEMNEYNTYKIEALPIGPISNPGIDSIKAAINPDSHPYLFFVSQNDGTHIFTQKYQDHASAVEKTQKNARARNGKSWRDLKQQK